MSRRILASREPRMIGAYYRGFVDPWAGGCLNFAYRQASVRVLGESTFAEWLSGVTPFGISQEEAERRCGGEYFYEVEVY